LRTFNIEIPGAKRACTDGPYSYLFYDNFRKQWGIGAKLGQTMFSMTTSNAAVDPQLLSGEWQSFDAAQNHGQVIHHETVHVKISCSAHVTLAPTLSPTMPPSPGTFNPTPSPTSSPTPSPTPGPTPGGFGLDRHAVTTTTQVPDGFGRQHWQTTVTMLSQMTDYSVATFGDSEKDAFASAVAITVGVQPRDVVFNNVANTIQSGNSSLENASSLGIYLNFSVHVFSATQGKSIAALMNLASFNGLLADQLGKNFGFDFSTAAYHGPKVKVQIPKKKKRQAPPVPKKDSSCVAETKASCEMYMCPSWSQAYCSVEQQCKCRPGYCRAYSVVREAYGCQIVHNVTKRHEEISAEVQAVAGTQTETKKIETEVLAHPQKSLLYGCVVIGAFFLFWLVWYCNRVCSGLQFERIAPAEDKQKMKRHYSIIPNVSNEEEIPFVVRPPHTKHNIMATVREPEISERSHESSTPGTVVFRESVPIQPVRKLANPTPIISSPKKPVSIVVNADAV
jgi:hypothetical protein